MEKNRSQLKQSSNIALAGVFSSLALLILFLTGIFPMVATFVLPAIAGVLFLILSFELGFSMAFQAYFATSFLSVFLVPDREAALFFIFFFGHYPLIRIFFQKHIKNKFLCTTAKLIFCNLCFVFVYFLIGLLFGLDYVIDSLGATGTYALLFFAILGNVTFVLYDYSLSNFIIIYERLFRKKLLDQFR